MGQLDDGPLILHATAIAFGDKALILQGTSGSGKSTLALQLIALGATLVADDRVIVTRRDGGLWLSAPETIAGRIEARHFGILACPTAPARAFAAVDMDQVEHARLPEPRQTVIGTVTLPLFRKVESPAFAAMLRLCLMEGPAA